MGDYSWRESAVIEETLAEYGGDYEEEYEEVIEEEIEEEPSTFNVVLHYCLTNGGLILILMCYTCIGAAILVALEAPAEAAAAEDLRLDRFEYRNVLIEKLRNISHWALKDEDQWWRRANRHLKGYEDELGINVLNPGKFESNWNFFGSMFFATTVLTTIGELFTSSSTQIFVVSIGNW